MRIDGHAQHMFNTRFKTALNQHIIIIIELIEIDAIEMAV
jgi:hypothetical protein